MPYNLIFPPKHTPEASRIIHAAITTRQAARQLLDILASNRNAYPIHPSDIEAVRKIANWDIPDV